MHSFTAHRVTVGAEVGRPLVFQEFPGSAVRGALYRSLVAQFCANQPILDHGGCLACPMLSACPVAYLAATLNPDADRGENVPRPFTVEPPLLTTDHGPPTIPPRPPSTGGDVGGRPPTTQGMFVFEAGTPFTFGVTLYAEALQLFPYVVQAVRGMGETGLGIKATANGWRRGTFTLRELWADNPITGERQAVLQRGSGLVTMPDVPIRHAHLAALPPPPPGGRVQVAFLTPTRLKHGGEVVRGAPPFRALFQRLLERLASLVQIFSDTPLDPDLRYSLVGLSDGVRLVAGQARWTHLEGYSGRQGGHTSISGIVGHAVYQADDWASLWPWLKWGEIIHVGKNAVKGEGMLSVTSLDAATNGQSDPVSHAKEAVWTS